MYTQTINLNMIPGGIPPVINVNQYDTQDDALVFKLYAGGELLNFPSGASIIITGTKPDSKGFSYSAKSYSTSRHTATFDLTEQMTAVSGDTKCELKIRTGDSKASLGTKNFILRVEEAALGEKSVLSETEIPLIEQAVDIASNLNMYIEQTKNYAEGAAASEKAAKESETNALESMTKAQTADQNVQQLYDSIETAKTNANTAADAANKAASDIKAQAAAGGFKGEKGDKGDKGDSGVTTELKGFISFQYDPTDGHLYAYSSDSVADSFQYDPTDGHLYYVAEA